MRFSTQRWLPGFCELRRSSIDNSQCTPHPVGGWQVWSAPIRKTPAFPPTGPQGRLCGKSDFLFHRARRILFFKKAGSPAATQRSGFCGEEESGEAPPAAEKASRFRGSGAIGGPEGAGNRNAATVCK
ncbi:MAG: hypothetical protein MSF32_04570, partial [Dysosmobacter sp.]|nr:hypothetical protein [Dysosmobacter sp.]